MKKSILSGQGDPTDPRDPYIKANNKIYASREKRRKEATLQIDQYDISHEHPKGLSTSISRE
jgi:hypothetical protein